MKRSLLTAWTAKLRSGDVKQGDGYLNQGDDKFCCLGVLCEVAGLKKDDAHYVRAYVGKFVGYSNAYSLPTDFVGECGISWGLVNELQRMNDELEQVGETDEWFHVYTFPMIADYIEKTIKIEED